MLKSCRAMLFVLFVLAACQQNDLFSGLTKTDTPASGSETVFVAVGGGGTIVYSTDGINWAAGTSGIPNIINDVASNGNVTFVFAGMGSNVKYSEDGGRTWTAATGSFPINSTAISYDGNGRWALGMTSTVLYSTDNGRNWTTAGGAGSTDPLLNLFYIPSQSRWVLLYNDMTVPNNYSYRTEDLFVSYNPSSTQPSNALSRAAYGNGVYVAVGSGTDCSYTSDGDTWTTPSYSSFTAGTMKSIAYGNGIFMAVGTSGNGYIYSCSNPAGIAFTQIYNTGAGNNLYGIAYGNGIWVAVGSNSSIYYSTNDGSSWQSTPNPSGTNLNAVAFGYR